MRIAYVINSVEGGGAALPVPAIARAMQRCGAEVRLFALTRRDGRALPAMEDAALEPKVRDGGETDHFAAAAWLDRQVAAYRPDILWTSLTRATLLGQLVGMRRGLPVASWQHAAFLRPANRRLLRLTRRRSALWLADSASVAEFTKAQLGIDEARIATWPLFPADADAPRAARWEPGRPLRIASLGRLHPVKGYDVLIAALALVNARGCTPAGGLEITIGGEGAERGRLEAQARAAGLDGLTLSGFVDDPRAFLAGQHLYVQPSRSEGFCVAAHEAMQAALPVIGSAVGEMANSILPGLTGDLVRPGDVKALASALERMLADPEALAAMGQAGRERLLSLFSAERFERNAAATYHRLAGLCRAGRPPGPPASDRPA